MTRIFENKNIFISGGTGYLGAELCRVFAEYGATVFFSFNSDDKAASGLMEECQATKGIRINLKDMKSIVDGIAIFHREAGHADVLVNNAGISQVMPFALMEEEDLDDLVNVNIKGTVFLTKEIIRKMISRKRGAVINIGSIAGSRILDVPIHYALTKASMSGFTTALASELKRYGIRVNCVVPGMLEDGVSRSIPEEMRRDYLDHCALGRAGTGREVAEVVCFLASDRASYVNGQNIFVDGGI